MKLLHLNLVATLLLFYAHQSLSQKIDTLVDVGGYKLHFTILKGKGTPILFEAGAGNDGSIWNTILPPIAKITGTTLITYDREGFGKSEIDTNEVVDENHGIEKGISALNTGLRKLGYGQKINLVAHSFGGMYATLYASRHPDLVNSIVFIDCNHPNCVNDYWVGLVKKQLPKKQKDNLGLYYLTYTWPNAVSVAKQNTLPNRIPAIDIVSPLTSLDSIIDANYWKNCHIEFANTRPNVQTITALGCGHYIFLENPPLVINAVTKAYCTNLNEKERNAVINRHFEFSEEILNDAKKNTHSQTDINEWGYSFLQNNELQKAIEVFKLNVFLYPSSWDVYDSYGEALLKAGQKEEAIKMYRKSIELNPKNENGKKVLDSISK